MRSVWGTLVHYDPQPGSSGTVLTTIALMNLVENMEGTENSFARVTTVCREMETF